MPRSAGPAHPWITARPPPCRTAGTTLASAAAPIRHRIDISGHDGTDAVRHVVAAPHDYLGPQGADERLVGL